MAMRAKTPATRATRRGRLGESGLFDQRGRGAGRAARSG
jgi:hypothetical protein